MFAVDSSADHRDTARAGRVECRAGEGDRTTPAAGESPVDGFEGGRRMSTTRPGGAAPDDPALSALAGGESLGHLLPGDLAPDEERLLAALERDAAALHVDPVDAFVASIRAGRDDAQSEAVGVPDDGLTPLFAAPDLDEG
jgi:hypothetical protein